MSLGFTSAFARSGSSCYRISLSAGLEQQVSQSLLLPVEIAIAAYERMRNTLDLGANTWDITCGVT